MPEPRGQEDSRERAADTTKPLGVYVGPAGPGWVPRSPHTPHLDPWDPRTLHGVITMVSRMPTPGDAAWLQRETLIPQLRLGPQGPLLVPEGTGHARGRSSQPPRMLTPVTPGARGVPLHLGPAGADSPRTRCRRRPPAAPGNGAGAAPGLGLPAVCEPGAPAGPTAPHAHPAAQASAAVWTALITGRTPCPTSSPSLRSSSCPGPTDSGPPGQGAGPPGPSTLSTL